MAKSLFLSLLKHYLFWLLLFAVGRTVFLLWNAEELTGIPLLEILRAYVAALYVDTAMACWLLGLPFVMLLIAGVTEKKFFLRMNIGVHFILFTAFFLMTFGELPIYDEWHTKLSYKALWFFNNPSEVFHTATWMQLVSCFGATAIFTFGACWLYMKKFALRELNANRDWTIIAYAIVSPAVIFTGMRGGYYTIPVQLSDAYYSQHNILNLISLNSSYNLASSCMENARGGKPYEFFPAGEAKITFDQLHEHSDSTSIFLMSQKPNIVLVVLEGWSADMIESFGGMKGITPNFDSLAIQGIRFTDCYASGMLSDQGMAAVFSGFPAQPRTSIITQPTKYVRLPCISKELKKIGYHTSFMFGGQLSYGNIRSYMYFNEFDKIIEGEDFNIAAEEGKLGYHDEFLFDRQLQELKSMQQPFFSAMFTLSTHGPYDFPMKRDLNIGDKEEDYVNSIYYADSCIGDFIRKAKREPWFDNTLFVFVSDHSHNSPYNHPFNDPAYRRIPMLFYGNVIDTAFVTERAIVAAQTDLAATLLAQLGQPYSQFRYSKNLFAKWLHPHAFYSFEEGFGFVNCDGWIRWSVDGRADFEVNEIPFSCYGEPADSLTLLKNGQAILQQLSVDYWEF